MKMDWLIIGGGIHGVHLAARLIGEGGVLPSKLRIVDPNPSLLERWKLNTHVTGMRHLRSPSVHHLDLESWSLRHYADKKKSKQLGMFAPPYARPALALFNAHCDKVIETYALAELHIRASAVGCETQSVGVSVELSSGETVESLNLIFAIGASEQPFYPGWASQAYPSIHHVFAPNFNGWPSRTEAVVVVGGGISAGQVALRLAKEGHDVHLVSRHPMREHQFDSDPGWLGPKFMRLFEAERDMDRRRAMITDARHRGSVPPDVKRGLVRAIDQGTLSWYEASVDALDTADETLMMQLSSGAEILADRVLLATGFSGRRPGGTMLDRFVESARLPCASCGYPIVDESLMWQPGIYVSGPLAELELGPTSRNIAGARRAGDRLLGCIKKGRSAA